MRTIKAFVKSHPLLSYFALTFAITWGLFVLAVGGPGGIPATREEFTAMPLLAILAVLVGPSVSGILLTGLVYGREGFRNLFTRMRRWRVGARWYAVALLTAPLVSTAVLIPLSLISPVFLPGIFASEAKVSFVLMGIVVALVVGIFEELGWTGFAVLTLLKLRYGVLSTGLIVGVLWGAWHLLGNDIWASVARTSEEAHKPKFVEFTFDELRRCRSQLPASRGRKRNVRLFEPSQAFDTPLSMPPKTPRFLCRARPPDIHSSSKPPCMPCS